MGVDATPSTEPTIPAGKKNQRQNFWPPFISRLYVYIYICNPLIHWNLSTSFLPFRGNPFRGERAWIWALWTRWFLMKCNEAWQRCLLWCLPLRGFWWGKMRRMRDTLGRFLRFGFWGLVGFLKQNPNLKNNQETTKKQTTMGVSLKNCCTTWGGVLFWWLFFLWNVFSFLFPACFLERGPVVFVNIYPAETWGFFNLF